MGQINLFALTLTDPMSEFLRTYKEGALRHIGAIRMLEPALPEEEAKPRCHLNIADYEYNYIIVEVADPLAWNDIDWLYRRVVAKEFDWGKLTAAEAKKATMRYAVERALTPPGAKRPRTKVDGDAEWPIVTKFRRCLELPAMALKHFSDTCDMDGHIKVDRLGSMLVIEYSGKSNRQSTRAAVTADEAE